MGITGPMTQSLMLSASLVFTVCTLGCSMRAGMNDACQWPSEPATALDPTNRAHQRHLVDDVRVAEELGIRYDDSRRARGAPSPGKPVKRDECDTALFNEIAARHAVRLDDVREGRRRLAEGSWNPAMYLPLAALYAVAALTTARRIRRRFYGPDEKAAVLVATFAASVAISASLLPLGHLWGGIVEMVRVGNQHMSYRADRLGWRGYDREVFTLGVLLFWSLVLIQHGVAPGAQRQRDV